MKTSCLKCYQVFQLTFLEVMAVFSSGGKYSFPQQSHYIIKVDFIICMSSKILLYAFTLQNHMQVYIKGQEPVAGVPLWHIGL